MKRLEQTGLFLEGAGTGLIVFCWGNEFWTSLVLAIALIACLGFMALAIWCLDDYKETNQVLRRKVRDLEGDLARAKHVRSV